MSRYTTVAASAAAATLAGLLTSALPATAQFRDPDFHSCSGEAGPEFYPCVWDARHEGDGNGHSYLVTRKGEVVRIPHVYAHRMRFGD